MMQKEKCIYVEDLINDPNFNTDDYYGYVYMTTNLETGRQYIGKKIFKHTKNKENKTIQLNRRPFQTCYRLIKLGNQK